MRATNGGSARFLQLIVASAAGLVLAGCSNCGPVQIGPAVVEAPLPEPESRPTVVAEKPVPPAARTVFFDFDKAILSTRAMRLLESHASFLTENTGYTITIEGHADERGTNEYNLRLGTRRAEAVRDFLLSRGISAARMKVISYGEERPADPGHSESAWAKNRRAVLVDYVEGR